MWKKWNFVLRNGEILCNVKGKGKVRNICLEFDSLCSSSSRESFLAFVAIVRAPVHLTIHCSLLLLITLDTSSVAECDASFWFTLDNGLLSMEQHSFPKSVGLLFNPIASVESLMAKYKCLVNQIGTELRLLESTPQLN